MSNFNYNEFALEDAVKAYLEDVLSPLRLVVLLGSEVNEYAEKNVIVRAIETVEPTELFGTATNVTTLDISVVTAAGTKRADHIALVADVMDRVFDDTFETQVNAKHDKLVCQRVERQARRTQFDDERGIRLTTQRIAVLCSMDG
jgi:hypothetical protein